MLVRPTTLLGILLSTAADAPAPVGGPAQFRQAALDTVAAQASGAAKAPVAGARIVAQLDIGAARARPSIAFAREIGSEKAVFRSARTEAVARVGGGPTILSTVGIDRLHRIGTGAAHPNIASLHAVAERRTGPEIIRYAALSCVTAST